jgi:hypothetical protein
MTTLKRRSIKNMTEVKVKKMEKGKEINFKYSLCKKLIFKKKEIKILFT